MVPARRLALVYLGLLLFVSTIPSPTSAEPSPAPAVKVVAEEASTPAAEAPTPTDPANGPAKAQRTTPVVGRGSILGLFSKANPMVWLLAVCSIVTVGFALERLVALRRERVVPRDFASRFLERLSSGKLDRDRAAELCRANESALARVFAMVITYWGQPAATIRQAIGFDAAGELSDLKRNIRVLNGTATLAPLLGLLGTVIGMIQSFDALGGRVGPAKGEALAQGISLALVTTALGLAIAVVSVTAYYYLLNRVDVLVRDLDEHARKVIDLVCAEAIRPASVSDRRPGFSAPGDLARQESRVH
jgi:biopolymer transport protein ExbB